MLVLSRKPEEQIVLEVGDHKIVVQVMAIQGNRVRLGFEAPRQVDIYRSEIAQPVAAACEQCLEIS